MHYRIIKKVMRIGEHSKKKRKHNITLQFLDRRQRLYAWDDEAPDVDEGLVEDNYHPTHDIPAEFPSIALESDLEDSAAVVDAAPAPEWAVAEQVLANAIVNDMNLGMLVLVAMEKIANEKNIHNINLN